MTDQVILYDIPSKDSSCSCWSLNVWRIRLALNFKGIDYQTHWVEYPDIEPLLTSFGIPPPAGQTPPYTVPAVRLPENGGEFLMNSRVIIAELERRYPPPKWPSLHLDDPILQKAYELTIEIADPLWPVIIPQIPRTVLNTKSADYFWATRKEEFGMSLDEYEATQGGEGAWDKSKAEFQKIAGVLKERGGPFFLGETVSYGDFVLVGFLHFLRRAVGDEKFKRVEGWPEVITLYQACEKWLQRDKY
ncbi:hypothetical protein ACJ41O_001607 [Fusarium nematophilum]